MKEFGPYAKRVLLLAVFLSLAIGMDLIRPFGGYPAGFATGIFALIIELAAVVSLYCIAKLRNHSRFSPAAGYMTLALTALMIGDASYHFLLFALRIPADRTIS